MPLNSYLTGSQCIISAWSQILRSNIMLLKNPKSDEFVPKMYKVHLIKKN